MKCQYCGNSDSKVIDSRQNEDGTITRRRRKCENCGKRFTTYEKLEKIAIMVIKKDMSKEYFDEEKIIKGIKTSCVKRDITYDQIIEIVSFIERKLLNSKRKEVKSTEIGEMIMDQLLDIDEVSYVRFASVYKDFKDVDTFMNELKKLKKRKEIEK